MQVDVYHGTLGASMHQKLVSHTPLKPVTPSVR